MPQIKFDTTSMPIIPEVLPKAGIGETGGAFEFVKVLEKTDKIVGNILSIFEHIQNAKNGNSGAAPGSIQPRVSTSRADHFAMREKKITDNPAEAKKPEVNEKLELVKTVLKQHIEKCAAENPEMPILEVLQKTELTAGQLLMLLNQIGG